MQTRPVISLLALVLLLCIVLAGCRSNTAAQLASSSVARIRIGVTAYKQDDTFITLLLADFSAAAKEYELENGIAVTINSMDAKGSQALQNEQVDRFLSQNYDVICVNMVDRTAAAVIIDKAKRADIPVIFFNREPVGEDMQRWNRLYYVGSEAQQSGEIQGQIVAELYHRDIFSVDRNRDGKLQYVMLEGEPGHQDALIRTEYAIKSMASRRIKVEKLATDTANWQRGQATTKMAQWIDSFGSQIEVVFCNNDDMALGAIDAYKAAGIQNLPVIVGVDGTPPALQALRDGTLMGTAGQDIHGQAGAMMELCFTLAHKQDASLSLLRDKFIYFPYRMITKETLLPAYQEDSGSES